MGLPRKLKNYNLFHNGQDYFGEVPEITLPKLSRKMEEYIAGGMSGPVKIDFGQEAIQMEWTAGGFMRSVLAQWGAPGHSAVQLRFCGSYECEDESEPDRVEIVVRGRHSAIDMGSAKMREDTAFKVTTEASYYKLAVNGQTLLEFDFMNMVAIVDGVDLLAATRRAIGR